MQFFLQAAVAPCRTTGTRSLWRAGLQPGTRCSSAPVRTTGSSNVSQEWCTMAVQVGITSKISYCTEQLDLLWFS